MTLSRSRPEFESPWGHSESAVITKAGKPVARLIPFAADDTSPRVPGIDVGKVIIQPDFDAPLPGFDL